MTRERFSGGDDSRPNHDYGQRNVFHVGVEELRAATEHTDGWITSRPPGAVCQGALRNLLVRTSGPLCSDQPIWAIEQSPLRLRIGATRQHHRDGGG
jgi:hypothetical protein